MKLGIVGAGLIAQAVATLARRQGDAVMVSNSRGGQSLAEVVATLDCQAGTVEQAVQFGDLVLVAIPFHAVRTLPTGPFRGKTVMDACNYYPGRDGVDVTLDTMDTTSGEVLARHLAGSRPVKVFNAIMARDIVAHARPAGATDRRALPIAGDDTQARQAVVSFLDTIGYDAVDAGAMAESWRFERGMPGYCIPLRAPAMARALQAAQRGQRAPEGSWRTPRELV